MRGLRLVSALLFLVAALRPPPAAADEATEAFHAAIAGAYRHYREASHYLETGNAELGELALDQFLAEWKALAARYAEKPPPAYAKDAEFAETLTAIEGKAQSAVGSAPAEALLALRPIRADLAALRKRSGQRAFSDCVDAMNDAMSGLYVYFQRRTMLDFAKPRSVTEFKAAAARAEAPYRRCRDEAPATYRDSPEFQRLFEGAFASFAKLGRFLDTRDEQQLYNTLGELRSFDKLIWLRFG
jgi:hypothetical protein